MTGHKGLIGVGLTALLFSWCADAPSPMRRFPAGMIQRVEFEPAVKFKGARRLLAAAVQLDFNSWIYGNCSGSFVSDDGLILTASHCVDQCRDRCDVRINGVANSARVVLRSRCTNEERKLERSTLSERIGLERIDSICGPRLDIAILRVEHPPENFACLPLGREYHVGEDVFTMGYPRRTARGHKDSSGEGLHLSYGKIIARQNTCLVRSNDSWSEYLLGTDQPGSEIDLGADTRMDAMTGNRDLQTTVDTTPRSSGSPLINASGEVIAVAVRGFADWVYKQCDGSSYFAPWSAFEPAKEITAPDFNLNQLRCVEKRVDLTSQPL